MARGQTRSRAPFRAPSQRRRTTWAQSAVQDVFTLLPLGTKRLDQTLNPGLLANVGAQESTIVRVRGILSVRSDQQVAVEGAAGAFGMIMVTDEAVAAGAASIPGPASDSADGGWFVWMPFVVPPVVGAIASGTPGPTQVDLVIDSRAMRKFPNGRQLAVVIENSSTVFGMEFYVRFRILLKLA